MSAYDVLKFAPIFVVATEGQSNGLFRPHKGKRLTAADRRAGRTPFVGASRMNNSITDFADTPAMFPGGWLTLIYNGDGGTGQARYQPAPFSASDDVIALEPLSPSATEPGLLLIASMLTQQCVPKFGFGYKLTLHRLRRQKIMAPVAKDDEGQQVVDWAGLTLLGEELMQAAKQRARAARASVTSALSAPSAMTFAPMLITDVFTSMKASSAWYDKSKLGLASPATYPFVSRTRENNGIDGACPRQEKEPEAGNAITIGLDTQTVAYQPAPFYTSQNIQVVRHERLNVDNGLVLVAIIRQQMGKFSWGGNGATLGRLRKTRVMVPVARSHNGEAVVDWEGMSRYGRVLRANAESAVDAVLGWSSNAGASNVKSASAR
jgi:hypothetical protein